MVGWVDLPQRQSLAGLAPQVRRDRRKNLSFDFAPLILRLKDRQDVPFDFAQDRFALSGAMSMFSRGGPIITILAQGSRISADPC